MTHRTHRSVWLAGLLALIVLVSGCSAAPTAILAATATATAVPLAPATAASTAVTPTATAPVVPAEADDVTKVDDQGSTAVVAEAVHEALDAQPVGELTANEVAGLLFMREEEKLARDVYPRSMSSGSAIFEQHCRQRGHAHGRVLRP